MKKIVINRDFGGFRISKKARERLRDLKHPLACKNLNFYDFDLERDDSLLVQVVEELGKEANDSSATLHIVEIPDDVEWEIKEYDGSEWVAEKHRTWE